MKVEKIDLASLNSCGGETKKVGETTMERHANALFGKSGRMRPQAVPPAGELASVGTTSIICWGAKVGVAVALASVIVIAGAQAEETAIPFKSGASIGVPVGKLPDPGLYFSWGAQYFSLNVKNDQGTNVGVRTRSEIDDTFFLYVPNIPQVLGAKYGAAINQTVIASSVGNKVGTFTNFGVVNTVLSPINLSWDLGHGFFASIATTFYPPGPNYHTTDVNHINRAQSTFEPGGGLSYLANGFNLTVHPLFDFNTVDPANGYHSGSVFSMDFTGTYKVSKFEFGVGGTVISQFTNDKINGVTLASVSGVRGYGDRAQGVNVGPVLGYNLGVATAHLYYTRAVYARNISTDDRVFFRLDFPVTGQRNPPADSEGRR